MKNRKLIIKIVKETPTQIMEINENIRYKSICSEIFPNIFLSGYKFSCDYDFLINNKFTSIINCAGSSKCFKQIKYDDFNYLVLDIKDDPEIEIINEVLLSIKFIEECLVSKKGKLLIHCFEGISRGPTLLAGYLIWKYKLSRDQAINFLKEKRPNIEINLGFLVQLDKWEKFLKQYRESNKIELVNLSTVNVAILF